ncbi:hypothetical protein A3E47_02685 [Candidatus Peribacteria bacterium RIFCSPHIGHO2_12_FULL_54_10]|nr:MAG: hypothetical protein A3E47_02685 [Candidatus Peribacteria bacterium RIFCSPHIGHO2_12_FULL_54_10]
MSKDIVRQSDFGKDLGLVHEMIVTGRKVGAGSDFYAALAHDEGLFRRVMEMVKEDHLLVAMQALQAAVEKGVQCENGVYRFFDPCISLVTLRDLSLVRQKKLVYRQDWYEPYDWAKREDAPQERNLRIPVEGSFNKTFPDQEKLLLPEEEVPSTRSVATFLVINALATGKRLLSDCYVRCIDKGSDGVRVCVGYFDGDGVVVAYCWDGGCGPSLGLAAAPRKS